MKIKNLIYIFLYFVVFRRFFWLRGHVFFCGLQEMATAPLDGAVAEKVAQRRANQDYTSCDQFLTLSVWQNLQGGKSERQRAEVLADFLFQVLGLRLPSEQTYGKMTAVVAMFCGQMTRSDLHGILQTVKSTWNVYKTSKGKERGNTSYLVVLPTCFEDLPLDLQANYQDSRPGLPEGWANPHRDLENLSFKVPLRETNAAVQKQKAESNVAQEVSKALRPYLALMGMPNIGHFAGEERALKNLRIFASPQKQESLSGAVLAGAEAAQRGQASLCVEGAGCAGVATRSGAAALMDLAQAGGEPGGRGHLALSVESGGARKAPGGSGPVRPVATGVEGKSGEGQGRAGPAGSMAQLREDEVRRTLQCGGPMATPCAASQLALPSPPDSCAETPRKKPKAGKLLADAAELKASREEAGGAPQKRPAAKQVRSGGMKRPSAGPRSKSEGVAKKAKTAKEVEQSYKNETFQSRVYGMCKVEYYCKKSYIRSWSKEKGKYEMVIGSSHSDHKRICALLVGHVAKGKSREDLKTLRSTFEN